MGDGVALGVTKKTFDMVKETLTPKQLNPGVILGVGVGSKLVAINSTSSQGIGVGAGSQAQSKYASKSKVVQSITGGGVVHSPEKNRFADISGQSDLHGEAPSKRQAPPGTDPSAKHQEIPL